MTTAEQIARLDSEILALSNEAWVCMECLDTVGMRQALAKAHGLKIARLELANA